MTRWMEARDQGGSLVYHTDRQGQQSSQWAAPCPFSLEYYWRVMDGSHCRKKRKERQCFLTVSFPKAYLVTRSKLPGLGSCWCGGLSGSFPSCCFHRKAAFFLLTSKFAQPYISTLSQPKSIINEVATVTTRQNEVEAASSPAKPSLDGPTRHRAVRDLGARHDALVLHQPEQLAVPGQINSPPVLCFSDFTVDSDLCARRQMLHRKGLAGRCHWEL